MANTGIDLSLYGPPSSDELVAAEDDQNDTGDDVEEAESEAEQEDDPCT